MPKKITATWHSGTERVCGESKQSETELSQLLRLRHSCNISRENIQRYTHAHTQKKKMPVVITSSEGGHEHSTTLKEGLILLAAQDELRSSEMIC